MSTVFVKSRRQVEHKIACARVYARDVSRYAYAHGALRSKHLALEKERVMHYNIMNDTGRKLHCIFDRHAALMWAARWCDENGYTKIDIDDDSQRIVISGSKHNHEREDG